MMGISLSKFSRRPPKDLNKHSKLMDLLSTYHRVCLKNNDLWAEKLTWCLENCQSKFRDMPKGDEVHWYFQNEQDAALFAMKWA